MSRLVRVIASCFLLVSFAPCARAQDEPLKQEWDYAAAMKRVASRFDGRPGVVLHVGDSITYANPYGQWARGGQGQTDDDKKTLRWMHSGHNDDTDGWYLARFDHPDGGRSYTACGGLRSDELLAGGKSGLPSLAALLEKYRPQAVVLMIGTIDASQNRPLAAYRADVARAVDLILGRGVVCILSTIPPLPGHAETTKRYNEALRALARERSLPLIDFEREILMRRPADWNGTLIQKNDAHPSANAHGVSPASAPSAANLRESGYLLRGWLSARKLAEVKHAVFDAPQAARSDPNDHGDGKTPRGDRVRVPVTRDTWFSNVGREAEGNTGGSDRLKLKSNQEMSLVDIDASPLKGRVISAATLHVRLRGKERLWRVTVGSFGAEWVEGTAANYEPQKGSSSHKYRQNPDVPWTVPGSDLCSVIFGQGGTTWRMADSFAPDDGGWQRVAVEPAIVAARVAGLSYGMLLFDDTGSEWSRDGEKFTLLHYPNRFVHSRESGAKNAPYFEVWLGARDNEPPQAPSDLQSNATGLPAGESLVSWVTPRDTGPAGTLGFFIDVNGQKLPRYHIPPAGKPGERVQMHLRDLPLEPREPVRISVRAVDAAGNVGPALEARVSTSAQVARELPGEEITPPAPAPGAALPKLGEASVAIIDELDKFAPQTAALIPAQPDGHLAKNHLWDAQKPLIRLQAARNEFVAFQILLQGNAKGVQARLEFEGPARSKLQTTLARYEIVPARKGPLPDPIVPLAGPLDVTRTASLHCEIYVPHDAPAGECAGKLTLKDAEGHSLAIPLALEVWSFTLPDFLSFLPEMNCYGLPRNEREYYRLAHRHRVVLNKVPYSQNGHIEDGCAPEWDGKTLDWTAWDKRFGPYFDGSAFADLPRKGVPIECFYLPIHENWPSSMEANYNGSYWADRAFPPEYWKSMTEVARQTAVHFQDKRWHETLFQCFYNGKNNFKANGWSRGSSPWLLDEPANFQDYWALREFGIAFHQGVAQAPGAAKMLFRADISRPEWQRDSLDGLLDYAVTSSAFRKYRRMVLDRKATDGTLVLEYGSTNAIEDANVQPAAWCLDVWSLGADGVLPWQTVGTAGSWKEADTLALFYPDPERADAPPLPSVRLKAYRRGQQDAEYLTMLALLEKAPRWALGQRVREALHLAPKRQGTGFTAGEDAGVMHYGQLRPQDLWSLRTRVGRVLSKAHPAPARKLNDLRTPRRDLKNLAPGYVSTGETPPEGDDHRFKGKQVSASQ